MSGKGCNKEHPKPCPKLIRHGNHGPRGCSAGTNCDKFHPKMCPQSLSAGECLTTDCKLRHIIGTRRTTSRQAKRDGNQVSQHKKSRSNDDANADFLDAIKSLKKEIMEAMDAKIATITTQLQATSTSPTPTLPVAQFPQIWGLPPQYQLMGSRMPPLMGNMQVPVAQTHL